VEFLAGQRVVRIRELNFPASVSLASRDSIVVMQYLLDERQTQAFADLELEAIVNYNTRSREDSTVTVTLRQVPAYLDSVRFIPDVFKLEYE